MTQEGHDLDRLVRTRIRALRVGQGWSLEELATRARLSQSTLSRIENGQVGVEFARDGTAEYTEIYLEDAQGDRVALDVQELDDRVRIRDDL